MIRLDESAYNAHQARVKPKAMLYQPGVGFAPAKTGKMRNKRIVTAEGAFDSQREYERFRELSLLKKAGKITDLKHHVKFTFEVNGVHICDYEADFVYQNSDNQQQVVEDVKPKFKDEAARKKYHHTDIYRRFLVKKRLMLALRNIDVQEV